MARELYSEVGERHVLYGIKARPVGHRQDCDDALFELLDGSGRFAVVHLGQSKGSGIFFIAIKKTPGPFIVRTAVARRSEDGGNQRGQESFS